MSFGSATLERPPEQEGRRRLTDTFLIDITRIVADPEQPRREFDPAEMQELVDSIRERGIKQPLTVRWNASDEKYMIIDGGRRFAAAQQAGLDELPCWVQGGDRRDILIDQIVHNWQRSNLRPMETADALARLRDEHGMSHATICRVTGKRKGEVSKFLALHDRVVPDVQQMARSESKQPLSKRHLYGISKLPAKDQKTLADRVVNEELSAEQTERIVDSRSTKAKIQNKSEVGLAARQRRFKTSKADVVITFRKKSFKEADVRAVINEISATLLPQANAEMESSGT